MKNQHRLYRFIREGKSFSGHERNCCFLNLGNGQFANISATSGMDLDDDARAMAITDWDQDGDLDVWVTNRTGPRLRFLKNQVDSASAALQLRLEGKDCNRDAIGARVTVITRDAVGTRSENRIKTLRRRRLPGSVVEVAALCDSCWTDDRTRARSVAGRVVGRDRGSINGRTLSCQTTQQAGRSSAIANASGLAVDQAVHRSREFDKHRSVEITNPHAWRFL